MCTARQYIPLHRRSILLGLTVIVLSACSGGGDGFSRGTESVVSDAFNAATAPLEDLNLKRRDIPPLLKAVAANPYALPPKLECSAIRSELAGLETVLGPDMTPREIEVASNDSGFLSGLQNTEVPTTDEAIEGGGNLAHDAAMGLIRSHTSILPFRSIIRRITGAERHQKRLEDAYQAGKLRRAYLKGVAETRFGKRCLSVAPIPANVVAEKS